MDIEAGDTLVELIKPLAKGTARPGLSGALGGFGAFMDLKEMNYKDPLLVFSNDGVGTKLKIAIECDIHDSVGIDLVAMCVNDLVVQGAEPVVFLDYYASGQTDLDVASKVIGGIAAGCKMAGCTLAGGETAEMPGMYNPGDYDLAGFAMGIVERDQVVTGEHIKPGDVILGLASDGIHSNGFSLVRKVISNARLDLDGPAPFAPDMKLAELLLIPTRIYVKPCLELVKKNLAKGMAHITGGGLIDNLPRVFPHAVAAEIHINIWNMPTIFTWLATTGGIPAMDMLHTFNCGIGMAIVVAPENEAKVIKMLQKSGETVYRIGQIIPKPESGRSVIFHGLDDVAWAS